MKASLQAQLQDNGIQPLWEFTAPVNQGEVWVMNAPEVEQVKQLLQDQGIPVRSAWRSQLLMPKP